MSQLSEDARKIEWVGAMEIGGQANHLMVRLG